MIGRIRTVKPEIFSDEKLWDLGLETGLPLLQAFQGLWCYADREGRFEWRPRALKTLILPYWEGDFARALEALEGARYVVRYVVDGQVYGVVRNFSKHQRVNQREAQSTLPPPPVTDLHVHARGEGNRTELEGEGNRTELAPPSVPGLERVADPEPTGTRLPTHDNLRGYEPNDGDYTHALLSGLSREAFDRRLNAARNTPIGGRRGVFDRRKHVREVLIPQWKIWEETDSSRARASPGDRLSAQAQRVEMLRAQEADEARRSSA